MRRLTAYSFAFKFLMDPSIVNIIADRTEKITLVKKSEYDKRPPSFGKFGTYGMKEKWLIAIFRKFSNNRLGAQQ
jgi:hypothetical protein